MENHYSAGFSHKDWYEKGRHLTQDGRHREAIEAFNLAISKDSAYAEAYFARGACYYVLGSYRQAAEDLEAAAILGCRDAQFWSKYPIYTCEKEADDKEALPDISTE